MYFTILVSLFIVLFTFWNMNNSVIKILGRFLFATFLSFLCFLSCVVFGPWIYIDYQKCMTSEEYNISNKVNIYERYKTSDRASKYEYDAHPLCVDIYLNDEDCQDDSYGNKYKIIHAKTMKFTGRIMKKYSLNAFTSNSFSIELIINNKKYWVSKYEYDEMRYGGMYKNWPKNATEFQLKSCSIFSIRNFTVKH